MSQTAQAAMRVSRDDYYQALIRHSDGSTNSVWLAQITASWMSGEGVLPDALGLEILQFKRLIFHYFPGFALTAKAVSGNRLDFSRMLEKADLEQLLRRYAIAQSHEIDSLIGIIVAACLGSDHLWQDMGLWSRAELSALLKHNFPLLAEANNKDMKWKKFLYKQLCEEEGLYVCRAPSCEVCQDYQQCFGSEEG